jgi:hypothetical protein
MVEDPFFDSLAVLGPDRYIDKMQNKQQVNRTFEEFYHACDRYSQLCEILDEMSKKSKENLTYSEAISGEFYGDFVAAGKELARSARNHIQAFEAISPYWDGASDIYNVLLSGLFASMQLPTAEEAKKLGFSEDTRALCK